ncbi:hypothetical protein OSTOST_12162, partial [Ostertagia ostertagi]
PGYLSFFSFCIVILGGGAALLGLAEILFWLSNPVDTTNSAEHVLPVEIPAWVFPLASFASFVSHLAIHCHDRTSAAISWKKGVTTYRFIMDQRKRKSERETISGQHEVSIQHVLKEERPAVVLGDSLTPKIADRFHIDKLRMQTGDNGPHYDRRFPSNHCDYTNRTQSNHNALLGQKANRSPSEGRAISPVMFSYKVLILFCVFSPSDVLSINVPPLCDRRRQLTRRLLYVRHGNSITLQPDS